MGKASHQMEWHCLLATPPDLVIASTTGWGVLCQGVRTGGPWSQTECQMHINLLELLAASLGIQSFAREKKNIHLKMDNITALTYINKYGGTVTPELNQITKELWQWCLDKNITLQATHLAGTLNHTADEESCVMKDRSDWMLFPRTFSKINQNVGPLQVDLFASRLTYQLRDYVTWRPDPGAMAVDAFTLDWTKFRGYANPPWNLVSRVLTHVRNQKAKVTLIAPVLEVSTLVPCTPRNASPGTHSSASQSNPDHTESTNQT